MDGFEIGRSDFLIDAHGRRAREFVANREIEMAAADAFADDLAHARLDRLEALRHAQVQIEEAMIHAADRNPQAESAESRLRVGVARHGLEALRLGCLRRLGRIGWCGLWTRFGHHSGPAPRDTGSASRNCIS